MRGYACVLVFGLSAILNGVEMADDKEGSLESFPNADKVKRKIVKTSDSENPTFNHLTSGRSGSSSSSSSENNSLRQYLDSIIPPFRYIQTDRYQPFYPSPYLHPVRSEHVQLAAPAASASASAHYSLQNPPIGQYFQSPTRIQFISTPAVKQLPILKIQNINGRLTATDAISGVPSLVSASQHSSRKPQTGSSSTGRISPSASSQSTKFSFHPSSAPVYYSRQSLVPFLMPQAASYNFFYQHPGPNHLTKQQPQQYFSGFHTGNGFGFYPTAQANQVNYLFPVGVATVGGARGGVSGSESKSSDKIESANLQSTLTNSFAYVNKV